MIQGWDGDYPLGIAWNVIGLVRLASRHGQLAVGGTPGRGIGCVSELMQALPPASVAPYEADVTRVQTSLGRQAFTAVREAGRDLPLEEMIDEAVHSPTS